MPRCISVLQSGGFRYWCLILHARTLVLRPSSSQWETYLSLHSEAQHTCWPELNNFVYKFLHFTFAIFERPLLIKHQLKFPSKAFNSVTQLNPYRFCCLNFKASSAVASGSPCFTACLIGGGDGPDARWGGGWAEQGGRKVEMGLEFDTRWRKTKKSKTFGSGGECGQSGFLQEPRGGGGVVSRGGWRKRIRKWPSHPYFVFSGCSICLCSKLGCLQLFRNDSVLQRLSDRVFPSPACAGTVSALQVCESTKGQHLHCYDPFDGKGWARAALLSITCLITPPMMKGSRSNLVIAKSLMSLGLRAARAGCECRRSRRGSLRSYCCTFTGHLSL